MHSDSQSPIWHNLAGYRILLASQSPRRSELLAGLDLAFEQAPALDIEEHYPERLAPEQVAVYLATLKGKAYSPLLNEQTLIIAADTVVIAQGEVLGKPRSRSGAERMLHKLSGQRHRVITAVCLLTPEGAETFADEAFVYFDTLSEEEIAYYLDHYRPYDKAGSYGIQEWIGYRAIRRIEGSFYTVMGLPTQMLAERLARIAPYRP